jgi:hypothetical protein
MHTPVGVTDDAMARVKDWRIDGLVALGGGSTIGLGKAIAMRTDLPQLVIPTTYAGSEATPILGETEHGRKTTRRDARILPEVIVYDVDLTYTLPVDLSVTSGINAIAHAIEALYARDRKPDCLDAGHQGSGHGRAPCPTSCGTAAIPPRDRRHCSAPGRAAPVFRSVGMALSTTRFAIRWAAVSDCRTRGTYRHSSACDGL